MEDELIHELAAGYALDALSSEDERTFEAHLATCSRCRDELATFSETAAALAYAVAPAQPPATLRGRILAAARADRPDVVPLRRRPRFLAVAAVAAVAAGAAIGLGAWAAVLHDRLDAATRTLQAVRLQGASGSLIRAGNGEAALVVAGLAPAPAGRTYETWVIQGKQVAPAGLFSARTATAIVRLTRRVPPGATVAVTLERAGGVAKPTHKPLVTASL